MNTKSTQKIERSIRRMAGNRIFSVTFRKRSNGQLRKMLCRLGVTEGTTGEGQRYDPSSKGLLTVYDMEKRAYRNVPLDGIVSLTLSQQTYNGPAKP